MQWSLQRCTEEVIVGLALDGRATSGQGGRGDVSEKDGGHLSTTETTNLCVSTTTLTILCDEETFIYMTHTS